MHIPHQIGAVKHLAQCYEEEHAETTTTIGQFCVKIFQKIMKLLLQKMKTVL